MVRCQSKSLVATKLHERLKCKHSRKRCKLQFSFVSIGFHCFFLVSSGSGLERKLFSYCSTTPAFSIFPFCSCRFFCFSSSSLALAKVTLFKCRVGRGANLFGEHGVPTPTLLQLPIYPNNYHHY